MNEYKGDIGLLITAMVWGMGFVATDIALVGLRPIQILAIRFTVATVILLLVYRKRLVNIDKSLLKDGILLGTILFVSFYLQTIGLQYTTPSKNAFLTATNVVIVPFLAFVIYRVRIDGYSVAGAILTLIGVAILSLEGSLTIGFGDFLTLLCAIGFAFQILLTDRYVRKYDPALLTLVQIATACALSIVTSMFYDFNIDYTSKSFMAAIYLGIFSTTIAYLLQTTCQKITTETKTAVLLSTEALFGTLFAIIFIGESLSMRGMFGCLLIFCSILITQIPTIKGVPTEPEPEPSTET